MFGGFAVVALVLSGVGLYAVTAYSVTQRTQEIGIRMALGASSARVQLAVVSETLRLTLIGVGVGALVSFAVGRAIASLLFGVAPVLAHQPLWIGLSAAVGGFVSGIGVGWFSGLMLQVRRPFAPAE